MATNDVLLQIALNNLDLIGNTIGGELGAAIAGKSDSDKDLADFKSSVKKKNGNLKDIPDEVYEGIMTAYYDAIKSGKDADQVLDELTSDEKSLTERIESAIKKLASPVDNKEVQITHSDGDVDTYTISFPLSGLGVDNVATVTKNNETALLSWEAETDGKIAMFKYFLSLWKLEQKLTNALLNECYKLFKSGAADLLKATYSSVSAEDLVEILGTDDKKEVKSLIRDALAGNSYLVSSLTKYGTLTDLYDKLQEEINSPKATYASIDKAKEKFLKASDSLVSYLEKKGVSIDVTELPTVLDPVDPYLTYNIAMTAVSVLAGHDYKVDVTTKYNKKVKIIDASIFEDIVEIIGNAKANKIYGGANDDNLSGGKGNDTIWGNDGNDSLIGDAGNDKLSGDAGNDTLWGGRGKDSLWGGAGNDSLLGEAGNDRLYGTDGDDTLIGGAGNDSLWSGEDNDLLYGDAGDDKLFGEMGDDSLVGGDGNDLLSGNEGNDALLGDAGNDRLYGNAGTDTLIGGAGNDLLWGGEDNDSLVGETGNDKLYGDAGDDTLIGGVGNDSLWGGEDNDILYGEEGNDKLFGDAGDDSILGGEGNDYISGNEGNDALLGDAGDDKLYGDAGDDSILGGDGKDLISGGAGNDSLVGETDDDTLLGGAGNDTLNGGAGNDLLWGGDGENIFYYASGDGDDTIFNYAAGSDKIFLASGSVDDVMQDGNNVIFKIGEGLITVDYVKDAEITVQLADGTENKYLNGGLVPSEQK